MAKMKQQVTLEVHWDTRDGVVNPGDWDWDAILFGVSGATSLNDVQAVTATVLDAGPAEEG